MIKGCTAVIVAAGSAQRMCGIDKMMTPLGGVPLLLRTVRALGASEKITDIIIVTRKELMQEARALCEQDAQRICTVVAGGSSRAESVLRGLEAVPTELVAIHDGARPLVTVRVIEETIAAAAQYGAAAPAIPVHDTIKVAQNGIVAQTPERSTLFAVQTPQVFRTETIRTALQVALAKNLPLTDDCSAMEAAGYSVHLTAGEEENLKITVPSDLILAEAILKRRETK
ncbi:MAG: 2-C-methyl-D-erythritol 4-phosphate cytidylyltransferase [Faecousia sp.]